MIGIFHCSPSYFLKLGLSLNPKLSVSRLSGQRALGISLSSSLLPLTLTPTLELQASEAAGDSNPGPLADTANAVTH